ncbi:MAG: F0F1 ATP synthase subunit A [Candidatus Omnitrophica bacterium]|jgi:F-type H+-transporting ATPase subunit a|nr:F0F1 ATP synthase subunit A [Candidatus Omnitrophota bacterium]
MQEQAQNISPELPDILAVLKDSFPKDLFLKGLYGWESLAYSLFTIFLIGILVYLGTRNMKISGGTRLQSFFEALVSAVDDFVCGILGKHGRRYTPFIGTLFIYILGMNLIGFIPFLKAPTINLSTTFALAVCVFFYVQYSAIKELGLVGYIDHLAGKPRGALGFTIVLPLMMFVSHIISELFKPVTLSLRLRSVIWGDDTLLAVISKFGFPGIPLLFLNMATGLLTAVIQACVFCILSTIYFAIFIVHEE